MPERGTYQSLLDDPGNLARCVLSLNDLVERDKGMAPLLSHSYPEEFIQQDRWATYDECGRALAEIIAEAETLTCNDAQKRSLLDVLNALYAQSAEGSGESMSYPEKVKRFTGLPNEKVSSGNVARLQEQLSANLARAGYQGSLSKALAEWRTCTDVGDAFRQETRTLLEASLGKTRESVVPMPDECHVDFEPVRAVYYRGYSHSEGPYGARITLNEDLEWPRSALKHVVTHEGCPGHFAISVMRRKAFERGALPIEESFFFANTPVTSVNEGTCNLGLYLLGWFDTFDDLICLQADMLRAALLANMCYLYHDEKRAEHEVVQYLVSEGGSSKMAAEQTMAFVKHPLWHTSNSHYWHGTLRVFDVYHFCMIHGLRDELLHRLYEELHTYASLPIDLGMEDDGRWVGVP
jgi:hypothetical protein